MRCEVPAILAGNDLRGVVIIDMQRAYPFPEVKLQLEGKETIHSKNDETDHSLILKSFAIPVSAPNDVLQPGHYEIPFVVPLPVNLPASMSVRVRRHIRANIRYTIMGDLRSPVEQQLPRMTHIVPFTVLEPLVFDSHATIENLVDVTGALRGRRGPSGIRVEMDKTGFHVDESVHAAVVLDNVQCRCDITRVQCTLVSVTALQTRAAFGNVQLSFSDVLTSWTWPGVAKGQITTYIQEIRLPPLCLQAGLQTISGTTIKREYRLLVVPMYDLFFVSNKPTITFPLTISAQPSQPMQPYGPPPQMPLYPSH